MSDYKNNIYIKNLNIVPVAEYTIANMHFAVYNKNEIPNKFIRFWQKYILGIKWNIK